MSLDSLMNPTGETEKNEEEVMEKVEEAPPVEASSDPYLDALLDKIQPVETTKSNLKVMIFADPGAGKTVFAGTADNNLIVDVERGLLPLNNHPDLVKKNVQSLPYKTFAGLELLVDRLNKRVPQLDWVDVLTIDSMSELHKRGLAEVVEREYAKSPNLKNKYVAETEHHAENNEHIRRLVSSMRDLDRDLILIAHSRTIEPKGEPMRTFPDFSEKLANTLSGILDVVGHLSLKKVDGEMRRVLRFHSDGQISAKSRLGGLPEFMIDPTWDKIMEAFRTAEAAQNA